VSQIIAQISSFIQGGYDTTSNLLAFTSYLLALNPNKEASMVREIDAFYASHSAPDMKELPKVSAQLHTAGVRLSVCLSGCILPKMNR
jgi:cytochrome P450